MMATLVVETMCGRLAIIGQDACHFFSDLIYRIRLQPCRTGEMNLQCQRKIQPPTKDDVSCT